MKKFRIVWLAFVTAVLLIFTLYRINEIRITDSSGPVITCDTDILSVSIADGEDVLLQGVTAKDKKDGDVTDSLIVEKISNFYDNGKRTVTYAAFDSDNHIAKRERDIIYTDYTPVRFSLTGSLRFRTGEEMNLSQVIRAMDCIDGDLSNKVKVQMDGNINNRMPGRYHVEYQVTNSAGAVAYLPVEVEVYQADNWDAKLILDKYLMYYDGSEPDYKALLHSVKIGNTEIPFEGEGTANAENGQEEEISRDRVEVVSQVNPNEPGVYPVYLTYSSDRYDTTEMVIVVVE